MRDIFGQVMERIERLAEDEIAAGGLPENVNAKAAARHLIAFVQGYFIQANFGMEIPREHLRESIATVIAGIAAHPPAR